MGGRIFLRQESRLIEFDYGIGAEALVLAVADGHAHALHAIAEGQGVVGISVHGKAVQAVDQLADGGEAGKQVLRFHAVDLGDGLALQADDGIILLIHPQQAVEQALPLQDLARPNLKHPAIDTIDFLVAAELVFVIPKLVFRHDEGLYIAHVGEVFVGHLEALQGEKRLADQLLGALMLGREDDVAHLAIFADGGTA